MLVSKDKLKPYDVPAEFFFSRRTGGGEPISRDQYFISNPTKLQIGTYCAIGNNTSGWELEEYNGINWMVVIPDPAYNLTITTNGLKAVADVSHDGFDLKISGIKIIDKVIINPAIPLINWTDAIFTEYGNVKLSVGTRDARYKTDGTGYDPLRDILRWRYNSTTGGMQYILTLPADGTIGSLSNTGESSWDVGSIGLYVKDPKDGSTDILFALATLPSVVRKISTDIDIVGNKLKFYFNTVLSNLGFVSNLDIIEDSDQSLPQVPNETLLAYPTDPEKRPYNCYVVNDLYGTNKPALAVLTPKPSENNTNISTEWTYFQPAENVIQVDVDKFDENVENFMAVYWDDVDLKYKKAEGSDITDAIHFNNKAPIGIRVGNTIVYSGEITNTESSYKYRIRVSNPGANYRQDDELLAVLNSGIVFNLRVENVDSEGAIKEISLIGPQTGNLPLLSNPTFQELSYSPKSQLPRNGSGARVRIDADSIPASNWGENGKGFSENQLNQPLYCGNGTDAGKPVSRMTDSFLGWCTGKNSIRLHLDLRNEASETIYGTTRYATNSEVRDVKTNVNASNQTAVTPQTLKNNYLQITKPNNPNETGNNLNNPIKVNSFVHFKEILIGKIPTSFSNYEDLDHIKDDNISFYGTAFRALYGDLAEFYEADANYEPGTLITMGKGIKEISIATDECNGIISTAPGYQLGNKKTELHLPVALVGRVPVKMDGNCMPQFGDKIYLSRIKPGCASTVENGKCIGKVIDKKINPNRLVECSIRIDF